MTLKEKVRIYESVFHRISYCVTAMNDERIREIVTLIDAWSYAHRAGNGELSEKEQKAQILRALEKLDSHDTHGVE